MRIYQGNRAEDLLDALLESTARRPPVGLEPELVLVHNLGMARWLTYQIARRRGIACNLAFPFPAAYFWRLFASVLPGVPAESPFDPGVMAWRLYEFLGRLPAGDSYAPLRAFLARSDGRNRMALARRVAEVFASYLVLRPDWLATWRRGELIDGLEPRELQRWQARLWREVLAPAAPQANPQEQALARIRERIGQGGTVAGLPGVLRVFGVPLLPPQYVELLAQLDAVVEVELYVLNPCREYWADIVSEREIARRRLRDDPPDDHLETGHPLLASWGGQARDNLTLLLALSGEDGVVDEQHFVEPAGEHALQRLQRSILELDPGPMHAGGLPPMDVSLQVHSCHSLTRELEVLHDQLLALFAARPDLAPSEVVVMLPDIDTAAPLVEAVFGSIPEGRRACRIPFEVSGRRHPEATPLLRAFAGLLALPRSRFDAASIAGLLRVPALARRFGLQEQDQDRIDRWLRGTGVRWGLDAAHKRSLGLPPEERHTWAEGLSRLLLGYALPGRGRGLAGGVLPYDEIEGSAALTAGRLARALSELAWARSELAAPRNVARWGEFLGRLLERMFEPDEAEQPELRRIQGAIGAVCSQAEAAGAGEPVPADVLALGLAEEISARAPGAVPRGGVTFCGLGTLRGLPWRVVCLLGMDDGAFPHTPSPGELDLMPGRPRLGDRSRRGDDRGSFLDALLCAREVFYLSYSGRSVRDNAAAPPSILVSELLDFLAAARPAAPGPAPAARVQEHRLQPFSHRYFERGGPLFTYASEYQEAAAREAAGGRARGGGGLFGSDSGPVDGEHDGTAAGPGAAADAGADAGTGAGAGAVTLPPPGPEWTTVEAGDLAGFFNNPARYVLQRRLGIELGEADVELPAAEPFTLERPGAWDLGSKLLQALQAGATTEAAARIGAAHPDLPHGPAVPALVQRELGAALAFQQALARAQPRLALPPQGFELPLGDSILRGTLQGLTPEGLFGWSFRDASYWIKVSAWIHHLVLCTLSPSPCAARAITSPLPGPGERGGGEGPERSRTSPLPGPGERGGGEGPERSPAAGPVTRWLCRDGELVLQPVPGAARLLDDLLAVYRDGLCRPPRFLPKTACALREESRSQAAKRWHDPYNQRGELLDPWYQLAFGGRDQAIPAELERLAEVVVQPMLNALAPPAAGVGAAAATAGMESPGTPPKGRT